MHNGNLISLGAALEMQKLAQEATKNALEAMETFLAKKKRPADSEPLPEEQI